MRRSLDPRRTAPLAVTLAALGVLASGCIVPGATYTGEGTYYAADGTGNCGFDAMAGHAYAAMNQQDYEESHLCGGWVTVTGPSGSTTVQIVDRCPECAPGDIDLSLGAFSEIADPVLGRVPISWNLHSGGAIGGMRLRVKDGANQWWLAVQALNHRNLIETMEVEVAGVWQPMARQQYNYFVYEGDAGTGPYRVRLKDNWGQVIVATGITLSPGVVQNTGQQFSTH